MVFAKRQLFLIIFFSFVLGGVAALLSVNLPIIFSTPNSFPALASTPSGFSSEENKILPIISPRSEDALYSSLNTAQNQLDLTLYQFSYSGLKDKLVELRERGVRVRLILEPRVDSNLETASFLSSRGIEVRWASLEYTNTHSKLALIDGRCVIVGSINWSRSAVQTNREAAVFFCNSAAASEFQKTFEQDWLDAAPVK